MLASGLLLLAIGLLGAFDVFYFHRARARITERPEARREAWIHVARGVVYTLQFLAVPNVQFAGAWYAAFVALYVADAAIAVADVLCEPAARREVGGLPRGEYLAHIVLSVLVGALLWSLALGTWRWAAAPTALTWAPAMPAAMRIVLAAIGVGCLATTLLDVAALVTQSPPPPVHVAVRLRAPLAEVWRITQDHRLHPAWDHRFTKITMLSDEITTGTCMRYEKRIAGMVVRGFGRYKLHRPMQQSTFEFWSSDPRSPIRRGVGLWRYVTAPDGSVEFRTSYSYEVRWGLLGRVLDRVVLRGWFQRETERSFARLRREFFADAGSPVVGRCGRKPAPTPELARALVGGDLDREAAFANPVRRDARLTSAVRGAATANAQATAPANAHAACRGEALDGDLMSLAITEITEVAASGNAHASSHANDRRRATRLQNQQSDAGPAMRAMRLAIG